MQNESVNQMSLNNTDVFYAIGNALMNQEIEFITNIPTPAIEVIVDGEELYNDPVSITEIPDSLPVQMPFVMSRTIDSAVHQLGSQQDLVYTTERVKENGDTEWMMAVFDGHGGKFSRNPFTMIHERKMCLPLVILKDLMEKKSEDEPPQIDALLEKDIFNENIDEFDENEDPALALQRVIGKAALQYNNDIIDEGATMVLAKIRHSIEQRTITVDILSVGDSTAIIHCNGEPVLDVTAHSFSNKEEIERLKREGRFLHLMPSKNFKIIGNNKLVSVSSLDEAAYVVLKNGTGIAMTQSLGHIETKSKKIVDERGSYGLAPYKKRIVFSDQDEINIKLFSDGVSDVIEPSIIPIDKELLRSANATEMAGHAAGRWMEDWNMCNSEAYQKCIKYGESSDSLPTKKINFGIGKDDVSCVSWIQKR